MLVHKLGASNGHAHHELATRAAGVAVPDVGKAHGRRERGVLGQRRRGEGLWQDGDGGGVCLDGGRALAVLALELDGHLIPNPCLFKQVVERVLGGGSLTGEVDGVAGEVLELLDGGVASDHGEHAQRVDVDRADAALGLVVEDRGHVGGHEGNVRLALDDQRQDLVGRTGDRVGVGDARGAFGGLGGGILGGDTGGGIHHRDQANGGGALEGCHADGHVLGGGGGVRGGRGIAGRGRIRGLRLTGAAGSERKPGGDGAECGKRLATGDVGALEHGFLLTCCRRHWVGASRLWCGRTRGRARSLSSGRKLASRQAR